MRKSIQSTLAAFVAGEASTSGDWLSAVAPAAGLPVSISMRNAVPAEEWKVVPRSIDTLAITAVGRPGVDRNPLLKDEHAIHQLLGYVHEACRAGFPLAGAALTNGRDWLVWRLPEQGDQLGKSPSHAINFSETDAAQALYGAFGRANLPLLALPQKAARLPTDPEVWTWNIGDEDFPVTGRVIKRATGRPIRRVWVYGRNDRTAGVDFAKAHDVDARDIEFVRDTCPSCGGREIRLGRDCSGKLPASWEYQLA